MDAKKPALQDTFLDSLCKEHIPVSIFLVNGIKLVGQIDSFDQYVVVLSSTVSQLVYKHAISTIVPSRNVTSAFVRSDETGAEKQNKSTLRVRGAMLRPRYDDSRGP